MKTFKGHLNEESLSEGAFKVGSVMEGIFAIAVALYLHTGIIPTVKSINRYRKKIIPSDMAKGAWTMNFKPVTDKRKGHPADTFNVRLVVRLKKGEMIKGNVSAYGPDGEIRIADPGDIPDLDAKINSMLAQLSGTSVIAKIDNYVEDLLANNTKDTVLLYVDADGVSGESSGGLVKGDVSIKILAKIGGKKVEKFKGTTFAFSLKSDSNTYANRGALDAIESLSAAWGIGFKIDAVSKKILLSDGVTTEKAMIQQSVVMGKLFDSLIDGLLKKPISNLKDSIFYLLKLGIFGSDYADVIEFKTDKIKELTVNRIHDLWNNPAYDHYKYTMSYRYAVLSSGKALARKEDGGVGRIQIDVSYIDSNGKVKTDELCHFRAKLNVRKSSDGKLTKEFKLMFEGGKFLQTYGGKNNPPVKSGYDQETMELTTVGQSADYIGPGTEVEAPAFQSPQRVKRR